MTHVRFIILIPLLAVVVGCGSSSSASSPEQAGPPVPGAFSSSSGLLSLEVVGIRGTGKRPAKVTSDLGADRDSRPESWRFQVSAPAQLPTRFVISATDLGSGANTVLAITTHLE